MSSNNRVGKKSKQVRDIKSAPEPKRIQVNHGNAPLLSVQLLNSINDRLIEIRELLKNGRS